jgi:hypothetical protein
MLNQQTETPAEAPKNPRLKYVTLTFLLVWVAAVFIVTCLKFAKVF